MLPKRLLLLAASLTLSFALSFGLAGTSQAQHAYPLTGGGLQYQIGGGLPLPIQATNPAWTGTVFPPLLIPPLGGTAAPTGFLLQGAGPDPKDITIIYPLLRKPASYAKIGVFGQNPNLYQVATNLSVQFPATSQTAMFQLATPMDPGTVGGTMGTTTTFTTGLGAGNNIRYSNLLGRRFGGPGQFFVGNPGTKPAGAKFTGVNATVWAVAVKGPGNPPCKHPAFGGANAACVAALAQAVPGVGSGAPAGWGAPVGFTVTTPGGKPSALATIPGATMTAKPKKGPSPGIQVVAANAAGLLTMSAFTNLMVPTAMTGFTNMASSTGYPWTTGMITVSAPLAAGLGEKFTITGMDNRVNGVGTIQLVSGTLSRRTASGPNANRAWLRLNVPEPSVALGSGVGLAMLALCHGLARRRSR
jgi:hypothetical protein